MRKQIFLLLLTALTTAGMAQNATNFTCNDCKGTPYDLFTELDAGKVIVLCWVMPCGACVGPTLTTYNVVQSFQAAYPDKVHMYLCDDFANTNCTSLTGWANSQGLSDVTLFSNSAIKMEDYGSPGMPKIVVVGDVNHAVFYNTNNTVNATALQNAIASAIAATITGIDDDPAFTGSYLFPNPSNSSSTLFITLKKTSEINIQIFNQLGALVSEMKHLQLPLGENRIELSVKEYPNGIYLLKINDDTGFKVLKVAVNH